MQEVQDELEKLQNNQDGAGDNIPDTSKEDKLPS